MRASLRVREIIVNGMRMSWVVNVMAVIMRVYLCVASEWPDGG